MDNTNVEFESQQNKGVPAVAQAVRKSPFKMYLAVDIVKTVPKWLWEWYIPRGKLTMISGDPGATKSTLICEILAAVSKGRPLPGETGRERAEVSWIMNAEDGADDTITWRLDNQDADNAKIWITDEKVTLEGAALADLEAEIVDRKISIAVIDTIATWMDGGVDINNSSEVSQWMNRFAAIAKRTDCAIVFLRHNRKSGGGNKLHNGIGSISFSGSVRAELSVSSKALPDGTVIRTVEKIKGNVGKMPAVLHYVIKDTGNVHGRLEWLELGDAAATTGKAAKGPIEACKAFLRAALQDGPRKMREVNKEALAAGFNKTNIKDARKGLVKAKKLPPGGPHDPWMWSLKEQTDSGGKP